EILVRAPGLVDAEADLPDLGGDVGPEEIVVVTREEQASFEVDGPLLLPEVHVRAIDVLAVEGIPETIINQGAASDDEVGVSSRGGRRGGEQDREQSESGELESSGHCPSLEEV